MWIDTHCHFDAEEFDPDRDAVAARAMAAGVEAIVIPGYRADRWEGLIRLCRASRQPRLYPAPGLHPCYIHDHRPEHLAQLDGLLAAGGCVAVGEIGLDTYVEDLKSHGVYARQQSFFAAQLELARQYHLPAILHVRKAHADVFRILQSLRFREGGVVHAFSGGVEEAKRYFRLGFRLGIGGSVTYPQAKRLHAVVAAMPVESLVIETDAPDMIPRPWRTEGGGRGRNSPEFLPSVASALAEAKGMATEDLAAILGENSRLALRLDQ